MQRCILKLKLYLQSCSTFSPDSDTKRGKVKAGITPHSTNAVSFSCSGHSIFSNLNKASTSTSTEEGSLSELPFTIQSDTYIWALSLTEAIDRLVLLFSPNSRDSVQNFNLLFFWFIVLLNYSANEIKSGQQQCSISSNHLFGTPSEEKKE